MSQTQTTAVPHLGIRNAAAAAEFYKKAFGAEILCMIPAPSGQIMHGAMSIDGAMIYFVDEFPDCGATSPEALGGTPVTIHLQVADVDTVFARAVDAGCTVLMPVEDQFWGDRYGLLQDPYGHQWSVATTVKEMSMDELKEKVASF